MKSKINKPQNGNRKIFTALLIFMMAFANAQVSIGGKQTVEGTATILDFNNVAGNIKGIILPAVDSQPTLTSPNNGTFIFDRTAKKVKMFENNTWVDLSAEGNDSQIVVNNANDNTVNHGAIIGARTSEAKGVLVLESPNKAMILPKIANPHTSVKGPYPGMMCYDTVTKSLAVFDGTNWNYWK